MYLLRCTSAHILVIGLVEIKFVTIWEVMGYIFSYMYPQLIGEASLTNIELMYM